MNSWFLFFQLVWHLRARSQGVKTAESWSILGSHKHQNNMFLGDMIWNHGHLTKQPIDVSNHGLPFLYFLSDTNFHISMATAIAAKGLLFATGMASSSSTCWVHKQANSTPK